MKWLFFTLVALNLIVFAAFLARKIYQPTPAPVAAITQPATTQAPPQVIINTGGGVVSTPNTSAGSPNTVVRPAAPRVTTPTTPRNPNTTPTGKTADAQQAAETPRAQYRACSARVSLPEDDYHRIKGLLTRFPHAATRQVVEGGGGEGEQTSARINVLFMSVTDQDASAIQAVVGRYGQLNRAPCNQ